MKTQETYIDYKKRIIQEFAQMAKESGFEAFIAERGTHGFYTNGERVVSFQSDNGSIQLSGNYRASKCGTGWRINDNAQATKECICAAIRENSPSWANKNAIYTTKDEHLKTYHPSSKYTQI